MLTKLFYLVLGTFVLVQYILAEDDKDYLDELTDLQKAWFKYGDTTQTAYYKMHETAYNITRQIFQPLIDNFNENNDTDNQTRQYRALRKIKRLFKKADKWTWNDSDKFGFIDDISNVFSHLKHLNAAPKNMCANSNLTNAAKAPEDNYTEVLPKYNCTTLDIDVYKAKLKLRLEFIKIYQFYSDLIVDASLEYYNCWPQNEQQEGIAFYNLCMQIRNENDMNTKVKLLPQIVFHF